jgi:hypothetical protein
MKSIKSILSIASVLFVLLLTGCQTKMTKRYYPITTENKEFATQSDDGQWRGPLETESNMEGVEFSDNKSFTLSFLNGVGI